MWVSKGEKSPRQTKMKAVSKPRISASRPYGRKKEAFISLPGGENSFSDGTCGRRQDFGSTTLIMQCRGV